MAMNHWIKWTVKYITIEFDRFINIHELNSEAALLYICSTRLPGKYVPKIYVIITIHYSVMES